MKNLRKLICFLSLIFIFILGPISVSASGTISENNANYNKYSIQLSTEDENGIIYRVFNEASNLDLTGSSDFVITEVFSEYTTYLGDMKVIEEIEDGEQLILSPGVDYIIKTIPDGFSISFIGDIKPSAKYIVSYNVQTNENAVSYYEENGDYPDITSNELLEIDESSFENSTEYEVSAVKNIQTRAGNDIVINVVYDNYDQYASEIDALNVYSMITFITDMRWYNGYYYPGSKFKQYQRLNQGGHGEYLSKYGDYVKSFLVGPHNQIAGKNVSFVSIDYIENTRVYNFPLMGEDHDFRINAMNWVEIINPGQAAEIVVHVNYVPDLAPYVSPEVIPTFENNKYIDYLGDSVINPDTSVTGKNDYRVYNEITTFEDEDVVEKKSDFVFVLDTSLSMNEDINSYSGKKKIDILKSTMNNIIDKLMESDPDSRISIVLLNTYAELAVSANSDRDYLKSIVNGIVPKGETNYNDALLLAEKEVKYLKNTAEDVRDTSVIFVTDGGANMVEIPDVGVAHAAEGAFPSAFGVMKTFPQVDNFYSMYIHTRSGMNDYSSVCNLQTMTQLASVTGEKNVVKAESDTEVTEMLNRFVARYVKPVVEFDIIDKLSSNVTYTGDLKVTSTSLDGKTTALSPGVDYTFNKNSDKLTVSFFNGLEENQTYSFSYNISGSDEAMTYYENNKTYPHIGDLDTDYPGNETSSGKPGFYSSDETEVIYKLSSGDVSLVYDKPVIQVHQKNKEKKIVINTVFDNYAEYSSEIDALDPGYRAALFSHFSYYEDMAYPEGEDKILRIKDGRVEYSTILARYNEYVQSMYFDGNSYGYNSTVNVSLASIECVDNAKQYAFPVLGTANSYRINSMNWVEIIEPGEYTEITLHFKYIPNIPPYEATDIVPNIEHSKYIDYLGDSIVNPDTTVSGGNDYRVYNNVNSFDDVDIEDNLADIVFVLDTSGSMEAGLNGIPKLSILKDVMYDVIDSLIDANPNNRISLITLESQAELKISGSSDKQKLKNTINVLNSGGSTNYDGAIKHAAAEVEQLKSTANEARDTTVIFITDGAPTHLNASHSTSYYGSLAAAYEAMELFPQVDNFYSMFIDSNDSAASNLQTMTQLVNVTGEKYVVKGDSEAEIDEMINRFVAKYITPATNISISDKLSSNVTYTGDLKVIATSLDGKTTTLSPGVDYEFTKMSNELIVSFKNELKEDTTYSFSYNIRGSNEAMIYYEKNQTYPHIGDFGTDYPGNETSSDKPGFYSSDESKVIYKISSGDVELIYDKPVIQVVPKEKKIVINTVFDNYDKYSSEIDALDPGYRAVLISNMEKKGNYYTPNNFEDWYLSINEDREEYRTISTKYNEYFKSISFDGYAHNISLNVSLDSIEYIDNARPYEIPFLGIDNSFRIKTSNWVEIIEPGEYTEITLHFKYIPNLPPYESADIMPNIEHSKYIDYLGDTVVNPDTHVSGENDYRVYNNITSLSDITTEDNLADIVFILDTSGSMSLTLDGKMRINILKSVMYKTINNLIDANPNNRISIISMQSYAKLEISGSSNKDQLKNKVATLTASGLTNYSGAINAVSEEVEKLKASSTDERDTTVIFLTDGEPTALSVPNANPVADYVPLAAAYEAMEAFPQIDNFYSMFISGFDGAASNLQTFTQLANVTGEKNVVKGDSEEEIESMINRFVAKYTGPVTDVSISDKLSSNVTYIGDLRVIATSLDGKATILSPGVDYEFAKMSNELIVSFKNELKEDTTYSFSYNIRGSDLAMTYYAINQTYPDIGDLDTDYPGNLTSSGQPGFYSSDETNLIYKLTSGDVSLEYDKPVIQVMESEEGIKDEIVLSKRLVNKMLTEGMFEFEIRDLQNDTTHIVKNDADGNIKYPLNIQKPGAYNFEAREVIPADRMKGMTYDTKVIPINVTALYKNGELVSEVSYPKGKAFVNEYNALPVKVNLSAKKVLNGKALTKDMFKFNLFDPSNKLVSTATNDGVGDIKFDTLTFTEPGEYIYKMSESIPMPADPFIEYSSSSFTAKITVVDNNGQLEAKVEMLQEPIFVNTYFVPTVSNTIEVDLILTGMQLTANAFTFEIKEFDKFNNLIDTKEVKNQANGKITANYTYDEEGVYTYLIDQVIPKPKNNDDYIKNMDFDEETIAVTVTVTRDTNSLTTSTTYEKLDGKEPKFYNRYKVRGGIW